MAGRFTDQIEEAKEIFYDQRDEDYTYPPEDDENTSQPERTGLTIADLPLRVSTSKKKKKKDTQKELTSQQREEQNQKKLEKIRMKKENKRIKEENLEFETIFNNFKTLKEKENKYIELINTIFRLLIDIESKFNKYFLDLQYRGNFRSTRERQIFAVNIYQYHTNLLNNKFLNKYFPRLIDRLIRMHGVDDIDGFMARINIYDADILFLRTKYQEYLKVVFDEIFINSAFLKFFSELYKLLLDKNEAITPLRDVYNKYKDDNPDINRFNFGKFVQENYKVEFEIRKYFENIFNNFERDISPDGILYPYFLDFKNKTSAPSEISRRQAVQMQERQRDERKGEYEAYLVKRQMEQQENERIFLERTRETRLQQARFDFVNYKQRLNQDIERQLEDYSYQQPESKFNHLRSLVDPSFRLQRPVPAEFICPISQEIMTDPVVAEDGNTYERRNIVQWFREGRLVSPLTNQPLSSDLLFPNLYLKKLIDEFNSQ